MRESWMARGIRVAIHGDNATATAASEPVENAATKE